jgi:ankyrin repeat protein
MIGLFIVILLIFLCLPVFAEDIHSAILDGQTKKVEEILKKNPYAAYERDYTNCTPLHIAVFCGNIKVVNMLLVKKLI